MDVHQYFLFLLNRSDYSESKLRSKALAKKHDLNKIEESITKLKSYNYINDLRLAMNLIRRLSRTKGKIAINQKLSTAGIDRQTQAIAWEEVSKIIESGEDPESYNIDYQRLKTKLTKKFKIDNWHDIEFNIKVKVIRWLSYHGFQNTQNILEEIKNAEEKNRFLVIK
jgi:SOS response regulatory protein OraA/RecX